MITLIKKVNRNQDENPHIQPDFQVHTFTHQMQLTIKNNVFTSINSESGHGEKKAPRFHYRHISIYTFSTYRMS